MKNEGDMTAVVVHGEIEHAAVARKSSIFYGRFIPLRTQAVMLLAQTYRHCFKLALAHPRETGPSAHEWAWIQIQPIVHLMFEWLRDWYVLACDGQNQWVRHAESIPFVPGETVSLSIPTMALPLNPAPWCAPSWLFEIFFPLTGIAGLKTKHVPAKSDERLDRAYTRLLLRGARRAFRYELIIAIETVRNEETAVAGAIPAKTSDSPTPRLIRRKGWQQRQKLLSAIQTVLRRNPSLQGIEFCAELDRRHAPPLLDWIESGEWSERGMTWKEAWSAPELKRKIRRVRQEAQKQVR